MTFVHEFFDWDLWRMVLDHGEVREVTPVPSSTPLDLDPAFSPDGRKLAFVSERGGTREIWVSNADGDEAVQISSLGGAVDGGKPSWSPDSRFLAFHANGIHVMPAGGGAPRKIFNDGEMPSWSADGRWIYFRRDNTGRFYVWKVPADGGQAVQAITSEASVAHEGPEGADLYFVRSGGGIWRRPVAGGQETEVIPGFKSELLGYWSIASDGIYYVVEESHQDQSVAHIRRFDFARRRTSHVGTLTGVLDDWVGGMTVSRDRRTILYSQRSYHTSEVMLVENFR